jgi:Protein of unknown function (DUF1778)
MSNEVTVLKPEAFDAFIKALDAPAEPNEKLKALMRSASPWEGNWSKELVQAIAMDIGKETVAYVEVMYPQAITATSSTFKLSLRNHIYNEIMAALEVSDRGEIIARLDNRAKFRRWWVNAYRKIRKTKGSHQ